MFEKIKQLFIDNYGAPKNIHLLKAGCTENNMRKQNITG